MADPEVLVDLIHSRHTIIFMCLVPPPPMVYILERSNENVISAAISHFGSSQRVSIFFKPVPKPCHNFFALAKKIVETTGSALHKT